MPDSLRPIVLESNGFMRSSESPRTPMRSALRLLLAAATSFGIVIALYPHSGPVLSKMRSHLPADWMYSTSTAAAAAPSPAPPKEHEGQLAHFSFRTANAEEPREAFTSSTVLSVSQRPRTIARRPPFAAGGHPTKPTDELAQAAAMFAKAQREQGL